MPDDLKKSGSPDNKRVSKQPWEQRYQQQKKAAKRREGSTAYEKMRIAERNRQPEGNRLPLGVVPPSRRSPTHGVS